MPIHGRRERTVINSPSGAKSSTFPRELDPALAERGHYWDGADRIGDEVHYPAVADGTEQDRAGRDAVDR